MDHKQLDLHVSLASPLLRSRSWERILCIIDISLDLTRIKLRLPNVQVPLCVDKQKIFIAETALLLLGSFAGSLLRRPLAATAKLIQFIQSTLLDLRSVLDRIILRYSLQVRREELGGGMEKRGEEIVLLRPIIYSRNPILQGVL